MAVDNFLRDVWSAKLLKIFETLRVWGEMGARDYEPDFVGARRVRINAFDETSVTVKDYTRNADIDDPEQMDDSQIIFNLDKEKYFNVAVDDVDQAQTNADLMEGVNTVSANAVLKQVEQDIADTVVAAIPDANIFVLTDQFKQGAGLRGIPKGNSEFASLLADQYVTIDTVLRENNVATGVESAIEGGRSWAIHGPTSWGGLTHALARSNAPNIVHGLSEEVLVNGFGGRIHDVDNFVSSIEPKRAAAGAGFTQTFGAAATSKDTAMGGFDRTIVFGFPGSFAFASQIEELVPYSPEKRFGDALKGLLVYGTKVLRPTLLYAIKFNTT